MKVCGFTFVRNAIKYDYPVLESINSILPLCDHLVVSVGKSEDDTRKLIESIGSKKIEIIDTIWDDSLKTGGKVLAVETNKAFDSIASGFDWCFYIQADEVVHEKDYPAIQYAMEIYLNDKNVDGLLFKYNHFYGSYDYLGDSRRWYRNEIRIIRNDKNIRSYKDAQGFRKSNEKLKVKSIDAAIFHYGWVKHPSFQQAKQQSFNRLWHDDDWMEKNVSNEELFDYSQIDSLRVFNGTHPVVMKKRIENTNWKFDFDPTKKQMGLRNTILYFIEKWTGYRVGEYKNYRVI